MAYQFYILYSESLDKFYYGHTADLQGRLRRHLSNHRGFSGKAADWKVTYVEKYQSKAEASARERQIKKWKNRHRVEELIQKNKGV